MNLFTTKLRRTATVVGGAIVGLGVLGAFATPALACHAASTPVSSCVNSDGTWVVNWTVGASDRGVGGTITDVKSLVASSHSYRYTEGGTVTGLVGATVNPNQTVSGVQTLPADAAKAEIAVTSDFFANGGHIVTTQTSTPATKPTKECTPTSTPPTTPVSTPPSTPVSTPPSTPASTPPSTSDSTPPSTPPTETTSPTATPTVTAPVDEPQWVYDTTCTTFSVGIQIPAKWAKDITVTFTPSTGTAKTVVGKIGQTTWVDFPASKGLTVTATAKGYPDSGAKIAYKAPASCTSASATVSTTPVALATTGSSSAPLAGGAAVVVLAGGAIFFLARRRKVKFTA